MGLKLEGLSLVKVSQDPTGSPALSKVWGRCQPSLSVSAALRLCLARTSHQEAWLGHSGSACTWAGVCCSWARSQVTEEAEAR